MRTRRIAWAGRGREAGRGVVGLVVGLVVIGAAAAGFAQAGRFLVVVDPFDRAELALVLSGLPTSRAFAARDLYAQGRVREILIIPEPPTAVEGEVVGGPIAEELAALGLFDPGRPAWAQRVLLAAGVPASKITVLPRHADGTIVEARRVRAFLDRRLPASLVLITSRSASRRARMIFRHIFKDAPVRILSSPTPYDAFEPDAWWSRPRNALAVVTEYQKLVVNALTLAVGPRGG